MNGLTGMVQAIGSALVVVILVAYLIYQLVAAVQTGAPQWFNDTVNNVTNIITANLVPILGVVIIMALLALAWMTFSRSWGGNSGGMGY